MHEQPQIEIPGEQRPDRGPINFAILVAAAAVVIAVAAFYLWPGRQSPLGGGPQPAHPPFGVAERAYGSKITIENLALSRAENFLHQEVTMLTGELVNTGETTLQELEVTVEFADEMNQIALRESRLALRAISPPLRPGERRPFEVSFEHIPTSWNRQMPSVRVSGLLFEPSK